MGWRARTLIARPSQESRFRAQSSGGGPGHAIRGDVQGPLRGANSCQGQEPEAHPVVDAEACLAVHGLGLEAGCV